MTTFIFNRTFKNVNAFFVVFVNFHLLKHTLYRHSFFIRSLNDQHDQILYLLHVKLVSSVYLFIFQLSLYCIAV